MGAARALAMAALLAAGAGRAGADGYEHPIVAQIVIDAPPGVDAGALERLVAVRPGDSLDRRAVRRAVQRVYGSGQCANVVARTRPAATPGAVDLVLECVPRRVIAAVHVVRQGSWRQVDEAGVRRAVALAQGEELWEGRLEEAAARVRALLARRGYRQARVDATAQGERQVTVELAVTPGEPTRVDAVDLGAAAAAVAARLRAGLALQRGAVLDLDVLDEDVRTLGVLLRRERFLRGRVGAPAVTVEGTRARVEIPVDPGPRFEFRFVGASAFRRRELLDSLGLDAEQALDAAAIESAAGHLRAFYQQQGHAAVRVSASETDTASRVVVVFRIDEGRTYRVRSVRFTGVTRDARWLRDRLDEAVTGAAPPVAGAADGDAERLAKASGSPADVRTRAPVDPRDVWNPPVWDRAVQRLVDAYRADGYLAASHERTRVTLDARTGAVDVEVALREGVQTRVASVEFEGQQRVPARELQREARIAAGDPLGYGAVEATRAGLLTLYGRRGFLYAQVTASDELSPDHTSAAVRFRIEEGPQVRLGNVVVSGARRTREDLVREVLALRPGDVYEPEAAARSQAALLRLNVFRSVGLRLADADVPAETKDLTVEVAERPWRTLAPGIGFSLANGPRAFVELVQPNLFGRALELTARAKVNYPLDTFRPDLVGKPFMDRVEGRADVGLHDPRVPLFGTQVGARVDAIVERLHRLAYDLGRASTVFGLDVPVWSRVTVSLQYELEFDHITRSSALDSIALTQADLERLRFPEGFTTLHSIRPVFVVDLRDNPLHPRTGLLASGTLEYVHSLGSSNDGLIFGLFQGSDVYTNMMKLSGTVTGYVPVGAQSVFALSFRLGRVVPLDSSSQTIGPKRFFLGGAATMRGYEEDEMIPQDARPAYLGQVRSCATSLSGVACSQAAQQAAQGQMLVSEGGEAFVLAKAELRVPLRPSVEAGLFADLGNLWTDPGLLSLFDLRANVGFGLRFSSPIGPAVLDFGFNVNPDTRLGERLFAPHFSIGLF
jgi:outer membrane protein assembly factor BamA